MVTLTINGVEVSVERGSTVLEAAQFFGFPIPTLCHMEGLSPYGACRLCVVEIGNGSRTQLVTSCTYPVVESMTVRTASVRVVRTRRMIVELLLASCPQSKTIQDIASALDVRQQRFRQEHEDCILCGRCVRMCSEQMAAGAIGFRGRGSHRGIGTPFDVSSEKCRLCGGCANLAPPCVNKPRFDDMMCFMSPCVACEIKPD